MTCPSGSLQNVFDAYLIALINCWRMKGVCVGVCRCVISSVHQCYDSPWTSCSKDTFKDVPPQFTNWQKFLFSLNIGSGMKGKQSRATRKQNKKGSITIIIPCKAAGCTRYPSSRMGVDSGRRQTRCELHRSGHHYFE